MKHANANIFNRYMLRGYQLSTESAVACCQAVACPKPECRAGRGWPCTSWPGMNASSTPHAARWEAYRRHLDAE